MKLFTLKTDKKPAGDQPKAIKELVNGLQENKKFQTLLGATGTGKTFTIANVINKIQKPTLIMAHNKTLASQLYSELKILFPNNRVEYYISYFDFYTPEAYKPAQDMYLEKQSVHNWEIEMMRMSSMEALLSNKDVIIVSSVASIYGTRNPKEWNSFRKTLKLGDKIERNSLIKEFVEMGYTRNNTDYRPGTFSVMGDTITLAPSWTDQFFYRIDLFGNEIEDIVEIDTLNKVVLKRKDFINVAPAEQAIIGKEAVKNAISSIKEDLKLRLKHYKKENQILEYERLKQRTMFDLEQLAETGFCSGIENYSIYFEPERKAGEKPYTLFDYFPKDFLLVVDESHITLPQIKGMYEGDRSRKQTLVDYGFRLPSALDNRPLKFNEFETKINQVIFVSATPSDYEMEKSKGQVVEQIIRPTGLLDPTIEIKKTSGQLDDLIEQIYIRKKKNQRVFINTVTKVLAEEIAKYISEKGLNVSYLHSDLKTFERNEVIRKLRLGIFDAVVGINLLREGLDVPEVSLMAILDANKEGYLRNKTSLIQIIGRTARNEEGHVIMYSDSITGSMREAIEETNRRREKQIEFNKKNKIKPKTIIKEIPESPAKFIETKNYLRLGKKQLDAEITELESRMLKASKEYDFEKAIELRDLILELKSK